MVAETQTRSFQLLIAGKAVDAASGETFTAYNPATNQAVAQVAKAGKEDVDRAVAAARKAFDEGPWPRMSPYERGRIIQKLADRIRERADEIAALESLNTGKPITRAKGEILGSAMVFDYYAGAGDKFYGETIPMGDKVLNFTLREPVGVVGQIVPWNFPFSMASWKVAPALAAGCCLILKPASNTPLSAVLLGEICYEAGVPEGVVSVLPGPGGEIGEYLAAHPLIDKIAFTGETITGARILKASADTIKKVSLELGGKSPNIVFADADLEKAAAAAVPAAFGNTGQTCTARTRLFVGQQSYDNFMQAAGRPDRVVQGRRSVRHGDADGSDDLDRASTSASHPTSRSARARAPSWSSAARGRRRSTRATSSSRRSSARSTTTCGSPARRSSARCSRSSRSRTRKMSSARRTPTTTVWPASVWTQDVSQGAAGGASGLRTGMVADQLQRRPGRLRPVRRLQEVRPRPRALDARHGAVHRGQERLHRSDVAVSRQLSAISRGRGGNASAFVLHGDR